MSDQRRPPKTLLAAALAVLLGLGAACGPAMAAAPGPRLSPSGDEEAVSAGAETPPEGHRHAQLSQGQRNMVKRAYQLTDIVWTPVKTVEGWRGRRANRFLAGETYTGIPYGQPHRSGIYIPWQNGLTDFLREAADAESPLYTQRAVSQVQQNAAPFFSCECSAFISWAWGLSSRETTHTLGDHGTLVGKRVENLQVGDCLLLVGKHARLVTDITYDAQNRISGVEISEERAPAARRFWYLAEGGQHSLSELQSEFLDQGYVILRCTELDRVAYTHSCAVPLPGDFCPRCGANPYQDLRPEAGYAEAVAYVSNQGIMSGTGEGRFSPEQSLTRGEMVRCVWKLYHSPASGRTLPFVDIKLAASYYPALRWAYETGCVTDGGEHRFLPEQSCTRGELLLTLWRAAGSPSSAAACPFTDLSPESELDPAVCWASELGLVAGKTPTTLAPDAPVTRAEAAVMLRRAGEALELWL